MTFNHCIGRGSPEKQNIYLSVSLSVSLSIYHLSVYLLIYLSDLCHCHLYYLYLSTIHQWIIYLSNLSIHHLSIINIYPLVYLPISLSLYLCHCHLSLICIYLPTNHLWTICLSLSFKSINLSSILSLIYLISITVICIIYLPTIYRSSAYLIYPSIIYHLYLSTCLSAYLIIYLSLSLSSISHLYLSTYHPSTDHLSISVL